MENKLEIRKDPPGKEQRIFLEGRLDATWAGHLDDYLDGLVREGAYRLILNMAGVQYLSSAGIRILVSQYKKIKKIGGLFVLESPSSGVSEVLNMVGMMGMFTEVATEEVKSDTEDPRYFEYNQYRFNNELLSDGQMNVHLTGNPGLSLTSEFTAADSHEIKFTANKFGIGIGAIGEDFEDCKSRYGEFLAVGDALVVKPSDGSKIPDYMIKTGKLEPSINALCALLAEGQFSNRISFEPIEPNLSISVEELMAGFSKSAGHQQFLFLSIAESSGLVGVSLNLPPVEGKKLFSFPELRENVNFTTEPTYPRMLTVSLGFYASNPGEELKPFLRPVKPGATACIHTHTAVFPYQALHKNEISAGKLVVHLLESSIVQDVLHLINDSREITGIGESTFKQGVAWIGKFS